MMTTGHKKSPSGANNGAFFHCAAIVVRNWWISHGAMVLAIPASQMSGGSN
jgi:hypothetical protein